MPDSLWGFNPGFLVMIAAIAVGAIWFTVSEARAVYSLYRSRKARAEKKPKM